MLSKDLESKFDKFNEIKEIQFSNMWPTFFNAEVLKFVKSIAFKDLQPENIYSIDLTLEVSKLSKFKDSRFEFPLNI